MFYVNLVDFLWGRLKSWTTRSTCSLIHSDHLKWKIEEKCAVLLLFEWLTSWRWFKESTISFSWRTWSVVQNLEALKSGDGKWQMTVREKSDSYWILVHLTLPFLFLASQHFSHLTLLVQLDHFGLTKSERKVKHSITIGKISSSNSFQF